VRAEGGVFALATGGGEKTLRVFKTLRVWVAGLVSVIAKRVKYGIMVSVQQKPLVMRTRRMD
jgi:hypothetical protein